MRLTRRKLAGAVLAAGAAHGVGRPQTGAPALPRTPGEELQGARARLQAAADALAKQELPMTTEPAFQFKA